MSVSTVVVPGGAQHDLAGGDVAAGGPDPGDAGRPSVMKPVTSQSWMMSTPAWSARRAKPQAT